MDAAPAHHPLALRRAAVTDAEGSGLGLAITEEIAHLHGARVSAKTPASGRGIRIEVAWTPPERDRSA